MFSDLSLCCMNYVYAHEKPTNISTRSDQKFLEGNMQTNIKPCSSKSTKTCKQGEAISSRATKINKTVNQETNPCSSKSTKACKQVETISSRATKINKTVNHENIVGRKRRRAVSPTASSSIELRECSQVIFLPSYLDLTHHSLLLYILFCI